MVAKLTRRIVQARSSPLRLAALVDKVLVPEQVKYPLFSSHVRVSASDTLPLIVRGGIRPLADINDQAPPCSYKHNLARRGRS
jgi:hypothetical protein